MNSMKRVIYGAAAAVLLLAGTLGQAQTAPVKMRISIDSPAVHTRTKLMNDYIAAVKAKAGGKLEIELFHSAQLYNDRDVAKALRQGSVEMAMPGTWNLGGIESNINIYNLPVFYGLSAEQIRKVNAGEVGQTINKSLETKLAVKVLGDWMELGYAHWYGVAKPIKSYDDLRGMVIRSPGGAGNDMRIKFFNANATNVPWPDVPMAMSQGKFDAFISTHESTVSAKLWESGMKHSFEDQQSFAHFVPMVNRAFWDKIGPDLQKVLADTWKEQVPSQIRAFEQAQTRARATLAVNGVQLVAPDPKTKAAVRERLIKDQDQWVEALKIEPEFAKKALQRVRSVL